MSDQLQVRTLDLPLSVRARNCLAQAGIDTVEQLVARREWEILGLKNMGRKTLKEIKECLAPMGLTFAESALETRRRQMRLLRAAPELLAMLERQQEWMFKALQAFEGHPQPSENEGKNIDADACALIARAKGTP